MKTNPGYDHDAALVAAYRDHVATRFAGVPAWSRGLLKFAGS